MYLYHQSHRPETQRGHKGCNSLHAAVSKQYIGDGDYKFTAHQLLLYISYISNNNKKHIELAQGPYLQGYPHICSFSHNESFHSGCF